MKIGDLNISIGVDMASLKKSTREVQKKFKQTGNYLENDIGKKGNKAVGGLTSSFKKLGGVLAGVFSVVAIVSFTKKLFQLGSDATEIGSKFDTVFGGIEQTAGQTFDNLADSVGRSKLELRKFGSDLGDVLKPLGFTTQEAADLSTEMVKLAVDVASFNNVQDEQVINAFKSALTGEREALKSLGIVMSEADVKQEALNMGLVKQGEVMSKQDKTLATYSLLFKNSTDAQGDAIRTSKSFANQLKRLQGVMTDTFAEAGKDVAQSTGSWLGDIAQFVQKYGVASIVAFIEVIKSIGLALSPILDVFVDVFGGIGELLGDGKKEAFSWGEFFIKVLNRVVNGIQTIGFIFKSTITIVKGLILGTANYIIDSVKVIISTFNLIGTAVGDLFKAIPIIMERGIARGINAIVKKIDGFAQTINKVFGTEYSFKYHIDEPKGGLFDNTKGKFKDLKNQMSILGKHQTKVYGDVRKDLKSGFNDFVIKMDDSNNKINDSVKTSAEIEKTETDAKKKRYEEMIKKYSEGGGVVDKTNAKNIKSTNDTKNKLDQLKNEYSKVEKQINELDKVSEDYAKNSKKYNSDIIDDVRKLNKELDDRKQKLDDEISSIELDSKNKLAERYVDIKEREKEVKKEIQDINNEDVLTTENLQKRIELEKELKNLEKEKASINFNVGQDTLNEAERKSGLSETDRILEEEKLKKEQAKKDYDREKEKLDSLLKINQAFFNLKKLDQQQLDEFQQAETFKNWSTEEQELFLKLAREKVSLTDQANYKLELERQINNEMINLSNLTLEVQLENNNKLDKSYDDIIAKINKAIIKQRELNALGGTTGYKDGGYTGYSSGGFTGSGDSNKVAGVVHAGEWVAPAWMLDSLGPVFDKLETMRSGGSTTKTINKTQNNNITVNSQFEAENFLDYANWKL